VSATRRAAVTAASLSDIVSWVVSPEPDRQGKENGGRRPCPPPHSRVDRVSPLVTAMYAGRIGRGGQHVRPIPAHLSAAWRAPSTTVAAAPAPPAAAVDDNVAVVVAAAAAVAVVGAEHAGTVSQ